MKHTKKLTALLLAAVVTLSGPSLGALAASEAGAGAEKSTTLDWTQFLGNEELKGVSDAKTPRTADELELLWQGLRNWTKSGISAEYPRGKGVTYTATPVILGDYVYYYVTDPDDPDSAAPSFRDKRIIKANANTGEVVARSEEFSNAASQLLPTIGSGGGMIYAFGCDSTSGGSRIYAFDQETLELVWRTEPMEGQQVEGHILYHEGYIYASTYWQGGGMYCFDVNAEAGGDGIVPQWKMIINDSSARKGFLWSDVEFVGDACVFGHTNGHIYSVNRVTGDLIDEQVIPEKYIASSSTAENITTTPYYYPKNGRIYISLAGAYGGIISYVMNSDGSFSDENVLVYEGMQSQGIKSSVIIYNDRLYVCGGGGHGGSAAPFMVLDANTLEKYYDIPQIASKGSLVMTTAYATRDNNQEVYLYVVPYSYGRIESNKKVDQGLYIIKDSIGQTEASYEYIILDQLFEEVICENSSHTMAIDQFGHIYVNNDSGQFWVFGRKDTARSVGSVSEYTAEDVMNQIARQPEVGEFKYYSEFELRRIKERYDNLSGAEQAKVSAASLEKLDEMLAVAAMTPEERLSQLNDGIAGLPALDKITAAQAETIENLYSIYSRMTDEAKANVVGADRLTAAYERVQELRYEEVIKKLMDEIDQLPSLEKLTLSDKNTIEGLTARLEALPDAYTARVSNAEKLSRAQARIAGIHSQLEKVGKLIVDGLAYTNITLESKDLIDRVFTAADGLAQEDLASLTSYDQYLIPALTDLTNLLIEQLYKDDKPVEVTKENIEELKGLIADIQKYYVLIPESDQRYITNYETIGALSEKIRSFSVKPEETLPPETDREIRREEQSGGRLKKSTLPPTGDMFAIGGCALLTVFGAAGAVLTLKKRRSR